MAFQICLDSSIFVIVLFWFTFMEKSNKRVAATIQDGGYGRLWWWGAAVKIDFE